jgi:hypothetical protein
MGHTPNSPRVSSVTNEQLNYFYSQILSCFIALWANKYILPVTEARLLAKLVETKIKNVRGRKLLLTYIL